MQYVEFARQAKLQIIIMQITANCTQSELIFTLNLALTQNFTLLNHNIPDGVALSSGLVNSPVVTVTSGCDVAGFTDAIRPAG